MTVKEWNEILSISDELGGDCREVIERLGREGFESMQGKLIRQFPGHADKDVVGWVMGMWRYHQAIEGRHFNERELDKVVRYAFYLLWLRAQVDGQYQALLLESGNIEDNKNVQTVRNVITSLGNLADETENVKKLTVGFFDRVSKMDTVFRAAVVAYKSTFITKAEELINQTTGLAKQVRKSLKAIEDLARLANVDSGQVRTAKDNVDGLAKQIDAIETELNLRVQHGTDSKEMWVTNLLAKGDRYVKENPQLFTWHCSECDWSGVLAKRRPPDGTLINPMNIWWTWRCPECGVMLAYDRKHPHYEQPSTQSVVFDLRSWELVCKQRLSLVDMAYTLHVDPEEIMLSVKNDFNLDIPEHVQKEFDRHERDFLSHNDGFDVQETGGVPSFDVADDTE